MVLYKINIKIDKVNLMGCTGYTVLGSALGFKVYSVWDSFVLKYGGEVFLER